MTPTDPENKKPAAEYDTATLIGAGVIFVGFGLLVYFLPLIMLAIGGESPLGAGLAIAGVLVLPFIGFWLRGRNRRGK